MSIQIQRFSVVDEAISAASRKIYAELESGLKQNQNVVLLLAGGSATKLYAHMTEKLQAGAPDLPWHNLSMALEDERWPSKSNEVDILKTGFITTLQDLGAEYFSLTENQSITEAAQTFETWLAPKMTDQTTKIVAVIGIGADGHTLSINVDEDEANFANLFQGSKLVTSYHSKAPTAQFPAFPERITLTLTGLKRINVAIGLVAGPDKVAMLQKLETQDLPINQMPAQALKLISSFLFTA